MSSSDQATAPALLHLEILTPEEVLFEGDVLWLQVPLHDGLLGIWPGHAPLVGALAAGQVLYSLDGEEQAFGVVSGVLRVGVERCAILISQASAQTSGSGQSYLGERIVATLDEALPDEVSEVLSREDDRLNPEPAEA